MRKGIYYVEKKRKTEKERGVVIESDMNLTGVNEEDVGHQSKWIYSTRAANPK